jgi:hypothetical protein
MRLIIYILSLAVVFAPVGNSFASNLDASQSPAKCCTAHKSTDDKKKCKKKCCHQSSACHQNCCSPVMLYLAQKPSFDFFFSAKQSQKVPIGKTQNLATGFENDFLRPPITV